jgi:hypothetical protein
LKEGGVECPQFMFVDNPFFIAKCMEKFFAERVVNDDPFWKNVVFEILHNSLIVLLRTEKVVRSLDLIEFLSSEAVREEKLVKYEAAKVNDNVSGEAAALIERVAYWFRRQFMQDFSDTLQKQILVRAICAISVMSENVGNAVLCPFGLCQEAK